AQAYTENVPMLIIPAGPPLARQYVKPVFRAADVYRPVTKWSALAHSVQELPDLMRRAYHAMRSGKGGPVMVEIPNEVFEAEYQGTLDYTPVKVQRAAPDPDAIKEAARLVLAVGSSLTKTPFGPGVPAGKTIIHSTNDADDINKEYRADHGVVGDARLVLDALVAEIGKQKRGGGNALASLKEEVATVKKA